MMRLALGFVGVAALAACTPPPPARSIALAQGDIVAIPPSGYCVDGLASKPQDNFALLAPCATLGTTGTLPNVVGIVTVQVGPVESGQIATDEIALRDFLITEEGAQLLSRSGDASGINILSTQAFDDQVMIHFTDQSAPTVVGLQREEWRAFRNIGGRLVTIAVRGLAAAPLQDGPGAGLLKLAIAGVRVVASETVEQPPET